jgi:hypothetical protein
MSAKTKTKAVKAKKPQVKMQDMKPKKNPKGGPIYAKIRY